MSSRPDKPPSASGAIRALIAEDSPTVRQLLRAILSDDPEIEVVGVARDGAEAVELTRQLEPDVITMDIKMPVMDGYEATRQIMTECPTPIVIVSGHVDVREMTVSFRALQAGALTLMPKPYGPSSDNFDRAAEQLRRTVKAMSKVNVVRRIGGAPLPVPTKPELPRREPSGRRFTAPDIVAIAASTGGPQALSRVVAALPKHGGVPILLTQHIAPGFLNGLATALSRMTQYHVRIAEKGLRLDSSTLYIAPDDLHLEVVEGPMIALTSAPPVGGFRPSATPMFQSVARVFAERALAIIMTGMGRDGADGLAAVKQAGGRVVAQDEATSVVYGMPAAAVEAGLADDVLALDDIAGLLQWAVSRPGRWTQGEKP